MKKKHPKLRKDVALVTEHVGEFMQYWGFKKIHGRIWALLFLSQEPLDATRVVALLKVSKTLVSFAVKELLAYDVIRERGQGPRGTVLLEPNPDISGVILAVLQMRERKMLAKTLKSVKDIDVRAQDDGSFALDADRQQELLSMVKSATRALELLGKASPRGTEFFAALAKLSL
jgi:DNA-binding transcriptional regulator GbsR (MarR family)